MYCTNCGAAVPLKEQDLARTCGSCGEVLYRPAPSIEVDADTATVSSILPDREVTEATVRRHPSTGHRPEPPVSDTVGPFVHLRVFTGRWEDVWVEAPNVTAARKIVFESSDLQPMPIDGGRSWGFGQAFILNQAEATENKGVFDVLPADLVYYLDRFGRKQRIHHGSPPQA